MAAVDHELESWAQPAEVTPQYTTLTSERLFHGESARVLADGSLLVVDVMAGRLLRRDAGAPESGDTLTEVLRLPVPLGSFAPVRGSDDVLLAAGEGFAVLSGEQVTWLATPEAGAAVPRRMNDAAADPAGRFWAGSMAYDNAPDAGRLHRLDPDGTTTAVVTPMTIPNGPVFGPDGTFMLLADSAHGAIDRFDVDPATGQLSGRRRFATVHGMEPDGMLLDDQGFLWSAAWGGSRLNRFTPDGVLDLVVHLPVSQPTSLAVLAAPGERSGPLVVTSATRQLDPARWREDGRVLLLDLHVSAPPARAALLR